MDITINGDLKLVQLSKADIRQKLFKRFDSVNDWSRVYSAFEVSGALISDPEFLPILGALLRLFKNGDVLRSVLQEADHFIKGPIFVSPKNVHSEADYHEHSPNQRSDAWRSYELDEGEAEDFANFIASNIEKMRPMAHSCRIYNMIPSTSVHLKVPLLFFVVESFFSDIDSEVVFKVALYVTNLLGEDQNFMAHLKKLYGIRSNIAHGDLQLARNRIKKLYGKGELKSPSFQGATERLESIVDELWLTLLHIDWEPSKSSERIAPYLIHSNPSGDC